MSPDADASRARSALREREAELAAIFEGALDAMIIADDAGRYVAANPAACELFGVPLEEMIGKSPGDFSATPIDLDAVWPAFLAEGAMEGEFVVQRPDGTRRVTEFRAKAHVAPGRHLSVLRDVTGRRRLEAELRHAQKMEGIGRLAGGIAHDFNNLLSAVMVIAHGVKDSLPASDPTRGEMQDIIDAATRGSQLTRQLLAFGRKQLLSPVPVDVPRLVTSTAAMLRRLIPESVAIELQRASGELVAVVDPSQLEQVLVNLALNARDAMPEGGTLTIATDARELDGPDADARGLPPGRYVRIRVRDTGVGMDADTAARIFEPFYTTKPEGRGTGLGLSTVYGIVHQSNGHVEVDTAPGRGATFSITLPRSGEPPAPVASSDRPPAKSEPAAETILVVEDEPSIREALVKMLRRAGYQVIEAANAGEALLLVEEHEASIPVLLTDVVLPRISGPRLARRLRDRHPEMRVIFMTGHPRDELDTSAHPVLQKPFSPEKLLEAVRAALERD